MLEFIKDCIIDFVLFSGIEGYIFCLFFEKICNCKRFKCLDWFVLSLGNCLISKIFPPLLYQIVMMMWMAFVLIIKSKDIKVKYLKYSFLSMFFMMIIEMIFAMIYENCFGIDFVILSFSLGFLYAIPIKLTEIFFIYGGKQMKAWFGESTKRK